MQLGFEDYAGSGMVHLLGGTASLVATCMVGPRQRRFDKDGTENKIPSHSAGQAGTLI
jgi:Amt family ammonium transporter